ncbi:hypothetical protein [Aquifex pyrophilus]
MLIKLLLAFLLLFLDFAVVEHHHKDYKVHKDCSVCLIQQEHNQESRTDNDIHLVVSFILFKEKLSLPYFNPPLSKRTFTRTRAPPHFPLL